MKTLLAPLRSKIDRLEREFCDRWGSYSLPSAIKMNRPSMRNSGDIWETEEATLLRDAIINLGRAEAKELRDVMGQNVLAITHETTNG